MSSDSESELSILSSDEDNNVRKTKKTRTRHPKKAARRNNSDGEDDNSDGDINSDSEEDEDNVSKINGIIKEQVDGGEEGDDNEEEGDDEEAEEAEELLPPTNEETLYTYRRRVEYVPAAERMTSDHLSIFEKTEAINIRISQIEKTGVTLLSSIAGLTSVEEIARKELEMKVMPLYVCRTVREELIESEKVIVEYCEVWPVSEMN